MCGCFKSFNEGHAGKPDTKKLFETFCGFFCTSNEKKGKLFWRKHATHAKKIKSDE